MRRGSLCFSASLVLCLALSLPIAACDTGSSATIRPEPQPLAVADPPPVGAAKVTIRGQEILVDVARSRAAQQLGLGRYRSLAWGRGMIFPYAKASFQAFWMKGMHFDIDIVWIRDGRIVGVAPRVPAPAHPDAEDPARVQPDQLVDLVLEVPAGYAEAHAWHPGERVEISESP